MSTPVTPEVHLAIGDLLARFCEHVDEYDIDAMGEVFTEDCVTDYGPGRGGRVEGRAATMARIASGQAAFRRTHHQLGQHRVRPAGETSYLVTTYVTAWHERWDGLKETLCLRYLDRVVLFEGEYRIAERKALAAVTHGFEGVPWEWVPRRRPADAPDE